MMNRVQKNKVAFSLLEMMLAMTIFAVLGMALFQMFALLTSVQTASLGAQHFKLKASSILERVEMELSNAVTGEYYLYKIGDTIKNEGDFSDTTKKVPYIMEFHCISGALTDPLCFKPGTLYNETIPDMPQIHFVTQDYDTPKVLNIDSFIEKMDNRFFFNQAILKEKVLYLDNQVPNFINPLTNIQDTQDLQINVRKESFLNGAVNKIDGISKTIGTGNYTIINSDIKSIKYLFWGNSSKNWNNDGSGAGNPILTWDSTIQENNSSSGNIHEIGDLPHAMKVILTLKYNPEQAYKRNADLDSNKSNDLIFERIIFFNYRGTA